jgi:hypothetical protein
MGYTALNWKIAHNDEEQRMWMQFVMMLFMVKFQHSYRGTADDHKPSNYPLDHEILPC